MKLSILSSVLALNILFGVSSQASEFSPQLHGWYEIPDSNIKAHCPEKNFNGYDYNFSYMCKNVTKAWSSATYDSKRNNIYFWGGGHHDYYGNEVYSFSVNTLKMRRVTDPAKPADVKLSPQTELYPHDGSQPNSRHTYDGLTYLESADKVWAFSGSLASGSGGPDSSTWIFDPETNIWHLDAPTGKLPVGGIGMLSAYDPISKKIYLHNRKGLYSYTYSASGGHYELLNSEGYMAVGMNAEIDPVNRKFLIIGNNVVITYDLDESSGYKRTEHDFLGEADFIKKNNAPGLTFNPTDNKFYAWAGSGIVYRTDVNTLIWEKVVYQQGPKNHFKQGTFGRFIYIAKENAFFLYNEVSANAYSFKALNEVDNISPSKPQNLTVEMPYSQGVHMKWDVSEDNVGIAGYQVFKNEKLIANIQENEYKYFEKSNEKMEFSIIAYDSANNLSKTSAFIEHKNHLFTKEFNLGNCENEKLIKNRDDIVFCEPWESDYWWSDHGYLSTPSLQNEVALSKSQVKHTTIINEGCIEGNCLKIDMPEGELNSLSVFWPLKNANIAPHTINLRYYLKLADNWDGNMCNAEGEIVGTGGKFPGLGDVRTWKDQGGQCGNGGASGDGINCWSHRTIFSLCKDKNDEICATKSDAAMRFGSYMYHTNQNGFTGDAGYWDADDWGQSGRNKDSCGTSASNMACGKGNGGIFEREVWYQIEIQITMNDIEHQNGIVRGWVDGELSFEKTNMEFRKAGHDFLHNRLLWLNIFKGGTYGNCSDSSIYLDQLVIAIDKPVGGMDSKTMPPPMVELSVEPLEIESNQVLDVNWQVSNAEMCNANGLWEGEVSFSGNKPLENITESGFIILECTGASGTTKAKVPVIVDGLPIEIGDDGNVVLSASKNITAEVIEDTNVLLAWSKVNNAIGYHIFLHGNFIAETKSLDFTHENLPSGVVATYTIKSIDLVGNTSDFSTAVSVTTKGGSEHEIKLFPLSDTFIAKSTYKVLGSSSSMDIAPNRNILLKFPIELVPTEADIKSVIVELHSIKEFGAMNVDIFAIQKSWHEDTASRDYANNSKDIKWKNLNGDWIDSKGVEQGDEPFNSIKLEDDNIPSIIKIDITGLALKWLNGTIDNHGLILVAQGNATQKIGTKENGEIKYWPTLTVILNK